MRKFRCKCWQHCKILNCKGSQIHRLEKTQYGGKSQKQGENCAWCVWKKGWVEEKLKIQVGRWTEIWQYTRSGIGNSLESCNLKSEKENFLVWDWSDWWYIYIYQCGTRTGNGSRRDKSLQSGMWRLILILTLIKPMCWLWFVKFPSGHVCDSISRKNRQEHLFCMETAASYVLVFFLLYFLTPRLGAAACSTIPCWSGGAEIMTQDKYFFL